MHVLGAIHQVADQFRIRRNDDVQGIFYGTTGSQRVDCRTHTADPAYESPGITGITALQDLFDQPYHSAGAVSICYFSSFNIGFYAQMTFNSGDRVNNYSRTHFFWFVGLKDWSLISHGLILPHWFGLPQRDFE